jgi:hypothetical protein
MNVNFRTKREKSVARGRMISKSLSTSECRARLHNVAGSLAEFCQQLYPLMVVHSDDFGRHAGDAFTVKHLIDPTSPRTLDEFSAALRHLDNVGLISWYAVNGRKFYEIRDFENHQVGLHKRTASKLPEPPGSSGKIPKIPSEEKGTEEKRSTPLPPVSTGGRRRRRGPSKDEIEHVRRTQEVKRLIQTEGLSFAEASRRVGYR